MNNVLIYFCANVQILIRPGTIVFTKSDLTPGEKHRISPRFDLAPDVSPVLNLKFDSAPDVSPVSNLKFDCAPGARPNIF